MPRPPGHTSPREYVCDCHHCGHHWTSEVRKGPPNNCPKCKSNNLSADPLGVIRPTTTTTIIGLRPGRTAFIRYACVCDCGHNWISRTGPTPDYCPKCRSKLISIRPYTSKSGTTTTKK